MLVGTIALALAAEPCEAWDLDATAQEALLLVSDAEFDQALALTEGAIACLEALPRVADPDALATLWLVRGAAGMYGGYPDIVDPNLTQAAAVHPGWFEADLGGAVRQRWVEASKAPGKPAQIVAWPIPDDGVLYVDGMAWADQPALVVPGTHLVQVSVGAEVLFAQVVGLAPEQQVNLETGLPEPTRVRRLTPWLIGGVGSGLAAGGAWTGAYLLSEQGRAAKDLDTLDQSWQRAALLGYVATPVLTAAAVSGVVLHFKKRERPVETEEE